MKWEKIQNIWSIFCWKVKCCAITGVSVRDRVYNDQFKGLTKSKITKLNLATAVILILTNFKLRIISHSTHMQQKIQQIRILLKTRMTYLSWINLTFINISACSNTSNYMQSIFFISSSIALKGHFCLLNYRLFKKAFEKNVLLHLKKNYVEKAGKLHRV